MITIICGTNRPNNVTEHVARYYQRKLSERGEAPLLLTLESLPPDFAFVNEVYGDPPGEFISIVDKYIRNAEKLVIISPEYNGSIPGVLKTFIDGIMPQVFPNKKAALVGVASGRAGNLRGMDHLTNILNYLGVQVLPFKVPLSGINGLMDEENDIIDENAVSALNKQMDLLSNF